MLTTTKKAQANRNLEFFHKYIAERKVLIADTNASSRAGLARAIIDLGARTANIALAQSYEAATQELERIQPHVVISDYNLGPRCGLDLLQTLRKQRPESTDGLFALVTANTSQSAVAQAAEEDVDTYILKPYTIEVLRNSLVRAAMEKMQPNQYTKAIQEGKEQLFAGKVENALATFQKAMEMDSKPALAYFYRGQAEEMKKALDNAHGSYMQGLEYNKIHYKCLVGLYELLMQKKLHTEAYEVIKKIARYFPANPQRLNSVVRLAILTQSYEDIERYYQIFVNLDDRNEDLIRYICAALVVCGKFYLQRHLQSRAMELFQKAAATASGRGRILREIILALVAHSLINEAEVFLKRFPPESQTGADYLSMEYLLGNQRLPTSLIIENGRGLIAKGVHDPLIYKILILRSREAGLADSAETLSKEATRRWPNQSDDFAAPKTAPPPTATAKPARG